MSEKRKKQKVEKSSEKVEKSPIGPKGWQLLTVALAREHVKEHGSAPIFGITFQDDGQFEDEESSEDGEKTLAALLKKCDTELRLYGHLIEKKVDNENNRCGEKMHFNWLLDKTKTGPYPDVFEKGTENRIFYYLFGVQTDTTQKWLDYTQHIQIYQDPPNVIGNSNEVFFWVPTAETVAKYSK